MRKVKHCNALQNLTTAMTVALFVLFMATTVPQQASAQGALVKSDIQRGAGNTARLSALTQQIGLRLAKLEKCNRAGLVYDPDDPLADINDCSVGNALCGDNGRLYGLNHPDSNANGCVAGLQVKPSGEVVVNKPSNHPNGLKVGETNNCNAGNKGLLRYESTAEQLQICNGATWNEF